MKRIMTVLFVVLVMGLVVSGQQPTIEGYWEGTAIRESAVRVIRLDIFKDGANLRCRVEMPDFISFGFPPLPVVQDGSKVTLRLPMMGEFLLIYDSQTGEMAEPQAGSSAPPIEIRFKRSAKPAQSPHTEEEVQFRSGDITLAGTLIKPRTGGPHPVIVWISGRGSRLRENSPRHRLLAQRGIASLIYDKRGSGKSTGDFSKATFNELSK